MHLEEQNELQLPEETYAVGSLVDVTSLFPSESNIYSEHHVLFSGKLWDLVERGVQEKEYRNDIGGLVFNILFKSQTGIIKQATADLSFFEVRIPGNANNQYLLKSRKSKSSSGQQLVTLMCINEHYSMAQT